MKKNQMVLVRTYSAGVHFGGLVSRKEKEITLKNASRIWRWRGANSLSELAVHGVDRESYTRISERVPEIILTDVIEILPLSPAAIATMEPIWHTRAD